MKVLIVVLAVVCAVAADIGLTLRNQARGGGAGGEPIATLRQSQEVNHDGSFEYSFETANGISAQESGSLKNAGTPDEAQVVRGTYTYTAPDGTPITVTYTADENGFHAEGAHLPVAPPIPEAILKSIAYNAANPEGSEGQQKRG